MAEHPGFLDKTALVIDNGTGYIKAGLAGKQSPDKILPTFVGRPKYKKLIGGGSLEADVLMGDKAETHRGALTLSRPMSHGSIVDWNDMERLWAHLYTDACLDLASDDHPVLLTDSPLNPLLNRQKAAEIFFEQFKVPALYVSPQATLSLYATGRTTGVVLDSGEGSTHVVPVYEGFAIPHAITRIDVAGSSVTDYMQRLLRLNGLVFHTTAERETVRDIKESKCQVAFSAEQADATLKANKKDLEESYTLPDGETVQIGAARFLAGEVLFRPSLIGLEYEGVANTLVNCVMKCDLDLRKTLFSEVVLSGGTTMMKGFGDRLVREVRRAAPRDTRIRVAAPKERRNLTWIGGSILASLSPFKKLWITKEDFAEQGARVVNKPLY